VFNFVQVQGQFHITVELDSRQAARKGDPAGLRESQREDSDASLRAKSEPDAVIGQKRGFFKGLDS
jgi:hypothetical protein